MPHPTHMILSGMAGELDSLRDKFLFREMDSATDPLESFAEQEYVQSMHFVALAVAALRKAALYQRNAAAPISPADMEVLLRKVSHGCSDVMCHVCGG